MTPQFYKFFLKAFRWKAFLQELLCQGRFFHKKKNFLKPLASMNSNFVLR